MSIECPYCKFVIKLKGVKAGRYSPKCPKCAKAFGLTVTGEGEDFQFTARALEANAPAATGDPARPPASKSSTPTVKVPGLAKEPASSAKANKPAAPPPPPKKAAKPAPAENVEATAAALLQADDPDTTSGFIADPPTPAEVEADPAAFSPTEASRGENHEVEQTTAGPVSSPDADFEADGFAEESEKEAPAPEDNSQQKKSGKDKGEIDCPQVLGGYELLDRLGKGGMGTVYLARQISLDRPVALKVMNGYWASDPVFVARFTREAYAAAQLMHHNVVQIYDIGEQDGINFFSMEYVKGQTLSDVVKKESKLDVDVAAGYILQAARGLKAAHELGMVHRDIKPDNLMLNDLGVVKVADLGLVKTPGVTEPGEQPYKVPDIPSAEKRKGSLGSLSSMPSVTNVGSAMGTPTYMPPEQAINAATVDHRADIYSLGCTFYVLLTGRVPFKGKTALEVMTKHLSDKPVPPEAINKRVPKEISDLILKMMAKKPEQRHADMGEVIEELEKFLGVSRVGPFSPSEEHADALEEAVQGFNGAPSAKIRKLVTPVYYGGCILLALLCCFFSLRLAGGILGLALMTAFCTFLVRGLVEKTYLFSKVREFISGSGPSEWIMWGASALLILAVLYMIGLLGYWVAFLVLSGAAAGTIRILIDKPLAKQRKLPIENAEKLLRHLRLKGLQEEAVRQFVCKYSGPRWEEFYEALFGYEALLVARKLWSRLESGKPRPTHAAWRDPVVQWIEARQRARKEAKERKHLQMIERKKLEAEGASAAEAKAKAEEAAAVMVSAAAEIKQHAEQRSAAGASVLEETSAAPPSFNAKMLIEAAEKPKELPPEIKKKLQARPKVNPLALVFGGTARFALGAVLIALCFLWVNSNGLVPGGEIDFKVYLLAIEKAEPLGFLPSPIDKGFSGFHAGLAGVLLVLSMLMRSRKLLFFVFLAVIALLVVPMVLPDNLGIPPSFAALGAGLALAEFGIVFNRAARPPA